MPTSTKKKVIITLIVGGIIIVIGALIITFVPPPKICTAGGCIGIQKLTPGCSYQPEVSIDPTLPTPQSQPYLGGFVTSPNSGPPFCLGVWYAYRFVTTSGGYSPLSAWSGSNPLNPSAPPLAISAGSVTLPCGPTSTGGSGGPGGCSQWGIVPSSTCQANSPLIIITNSIPTLPFGTVLNVHRQSGQTFDPTSEGEIVGMMVIGPRSGVPIPVYAFFNDSAPYTNPDPNSQASSCCS